MRQIFQDLADGALSVADVPAPGPRPGHLLIRTSASVISAGTERMLVEFGQANLLEKARQQPDRVRQVMDKARTDGVASAVESVRARLAEPIALGYCNVGRVLSVGKGVSGFTEGQRVVSNGPHAEVVSVPATLCAGVPDASPAISDEAAAFTVLGAIGTEGIRLAEPTLGERFVVTGLGLIGLLAAQLLRANGCAVLGIDVDRQRLELARQFGVETVDLTAGEDPIEAARSFSRGRGVDGVLIAASTKSSEPIRQAARMCRTRGRLVLIGVAGTELSRDDFYAKELSFQVSCSYGPGRYDQAYEEEGHDYPFGHVRWTEGRNFEAVLDMLATKRLDVEPLITHRFAFDDAERAYEVLANGESSLGIVLQYASDSTVPDSRLERRDIMHGRRDARRRGLGRQPTIGVVGAGNYATRVVLPTLEDLGADVAAVASHGGASAGIAAERFGIPRSSSDAEAVIRDPAVDAVMVTTRHDTHAALACMALRSDTHVFVEKPLAITRETLEQVRAEHDAARERHAAPLLTVGFNRRFAPLVVRMRDLLSTVEQPKAVIVTVNAGALPDGHWTRDPLVGGGRIVGEACHFVDLVRNLVGAPITRVTAAGLEDSYAAHGPETATLMLNFADGSTGTVHYLTNGSRAFPKERVEVFTVGRVLVLDNFRRLQGYGWPGFRRESSRRQDKGHRALLTAFLAAVTSGERAPIPVDEIFETHEACFTAVEQLASAGQPR